MYYLFSIEVNNMTTNRRIDDEFLTFLEQIQGDTYGSIHQSRRLFRYLLFKFDDHMFFVVNSQPRVCDIVSSRKSILMLISLHLILLMSIV